MAYTVLQFAGMVLFMSVIVHAGPTCLECVDVVAPTDCEFVRTCGDHEQCFLDVLVTTAGAIRFSMGCRDAKHCNASSSGRRSVDRTIRSAGDIIVCDECCDNKAMCNNALCGYKGYPTVRGPICFNCKEQNGTNDCQKITMCGQDQMCMLHRTSNGVTHEQRFETKCESKQQCLSSVNTLRQGMGIIGKRSSNAVALYGKCIIQCCDDDICNNNCHNTGGSIIIPPTKTTTTSTTTSTTTTSKPTPVDYCRSRPCNNGGTCISGSTTFSCRCTTSFTGATCSQHKNYCASNPCGAGTCTSHATSFTCSCDRGNTGRRCEHKDYCAIDHCQNGKCVNGATTYTCDCYTGYTGTNCQTRVVSHSPLSVGDKVVPGPDWFLDERVTIGTVTRMNDLDHPESVWVLWNTGLITVSQYGHNGKYEVVHA
ncbi:Hyaluronan-binding protein 2 [Mactra antiquata]